MTKKPLFIVFEGIDGSGKTTLARLLKEKLTAKGLDVLLTCEPTNGKWGKRLRESFNADKRLSLEEELDLFLKDRREHVETVIKPALLKGSVVICDRYYYSTMAYQGARGMDVKEIASRNQAFAPEPDIVFLLRLNPEMALKRIQEKRGDSPNNFEKLEYLKKVDAIFRNMNKDNFVSIDAAQPLKTSLEKMVQIMDKRFGIDC